MDIDALHSALLSITVVSEKIHSARAMLPASGNSPVELGKFLANVESDLRIAKATLAQELGFTLCPSCWPPEFVTMDPDGHPHCPACGSVTYEQAA